MLFELKNHTSAKVLATVAGRDKDTTAENKSYDKQYGGEFLKFCIELDTQTPNISGFFLEKQGRNPLWVHLKYVKLPNICFKCGKLKHDTKICTKQSINGNNLYGKWLSAEEKSWNILVWTENVVDRSNFRTVSLT